MDTSAIFFGGHVDISGNHFITGTNGNKGYIYERNGTTWSLNSQLNYPNIPDFPMPTAIFGSHAIMVTINNLGSVALFVNSGTNWILQDTLRGSDITDIMLFGWAADISDNNVIVGAPVEFGNGLLSGSAYIYIYISVLEQRV